jgi:hypothetical protein
MIDDLRARFLRKFLDGATVRVSRGLEAAEQGEPAAAWGQLHALAGEAAILGLSELAEAARLGSAAARRWMDAGEAGAREECEQALRTLRTGVAQLDAEDRGGGNAAS